MAAILRVLRQSMRAAGCGEAHGLVGRDRQLTIAAVEIELTLEEPELLSLPDNDDVDQEFRDRSTGLPLNPEMVKKARELEMQYMELKVLEDSDRDVCMTETGRPPIPTGWVDINKGDSLRPNYRSKLVCQETRGRSTIDVDDWAATFAATPPYEAFKLQLSLMMTVQLVRAEGGERWELEADPRHVEILVSQMGLRNESKAVSTPGVLTTDEKDGKELDAEDRACNRSWTMRASYLSQDR